MTAVHAAGETAAPTSSAGGGATGDGASSYVVRWDEGQKLYRVWNSSSNSWAPRPGFSDERVARAVADSLTTPPVRVGR